MNHLQTGKRGEALAVAYLQKKKYKIYGQNIRLGRDEIDVLAYDIEERMLVFVEVKTRSRYDPDFLPALGVTQRKKRALRRAAWKWMYQKEYEAPWRIDVILVIGSRIYKHIKQIH
ncbi:MAG: YraN family protein [Candidatus Peribacteraceae bacterium]|jgi:putative endonuclease|nr:YraN family protein [Candidatus Peribacteraceae bacterium]|tara:strand:- start:14515 stop:14862 length:348 start_codon:yes stop_codon:yes gene_type:complete